MILLGLAAIVWVAVHIGVAGSRLRDRLVARVGEQGFMIGFSLASVASLVALVFAYRAAPEDLMWLAPAWLGWLLVAAMLPACMLFVGVGLQPKSHRDRRGRRELPRVARQCAPRAASRW